MTQRANPTELAILDAIVVPLKSFAAAKQRLRRGGALDVSNLVEQLAIGVIRHCAPRRVIVLCESDDVEAFARIHHVEVRRTAATGLNEAIQSAHHDLGTELDRLIIAHGDLRQPEGLGEVSPAPGVTIVTDHHGRGTNVLVVPTKVDFQFAFGEDSATAHSREAQRLGLACHVVTGSPWGFDVDEVVDLEPPSDGV